MPVIDLTPFSLTPTESVAYGALLQHGPLSGYALAKALNIARANAYHALNGLVTKQLAYPTGERPQRYRHLEPHAMFALLAEREARKLDRLEDQLQDAPTGGASAVIPVTGRRALEELALRTAARSAGEVRCLASPEFLVSLAPVWHRRASVDAGSELWAVGDRGGELPFALSGWVDPQVVKTYFGGSVVLLQAAHAAVVAALEPAPPTGHWTSDLALIGVVRSSLSRLTGT